MEEKGKKIIGILIFIAVILPFFFFFLKQKIKRPKILEVSPPPCTLYFVEKYLPSTIWREVGVKYEILLKDYIPTPPPPTPSYTPNDNTFKLHWDCNQATISSFRVIRVDDANNESDFSSSCSVVEENNNTTPCNLDTGCIPVNNRQQGDIICRNINEENEGEQKIYIKAIKE